MGMLLRLHLNKNTSGCGFNPLDSIPLYPGCKGILGYIRDILK